MIFGTINNSFVTYNKIVGGNNLLFIKIFRKSIVCYIKRIKAVDHV